MLLLLHLACTSEDKETIKEDSCSLKEYPNRSICFTPRFTQNANPMLILLSMEAILVAYNLPNEEANLDYLSRLD